MFGCMMPVEMVMGGVCPTLTGDHENRITDYTAVVVLAIGATDAHASITDETIAPTVLARAGTGGGNEPIVLLNNQKYILRRLTPTECARLQGFPDWWCDGAEGSDSAQYKLWGNGIALPCAVDVLGRIVEAINNE